MTSEPPRGPGRSTLADVQARSMRAASAATLEAWPAEDALTGAELDAFLERCHYGVFATTRPDGRPHATPVAFVHRGGLVWIASVAGSARLRNLVHHPYASLVVGDCEGGDHVAVVVEGDVVLHPDPEPILSAFLQDAWRVRFGKELDWAGAVIELIPFKVLSHGRGRVPTDRTG